MNPEKNIGPVVTAGILIGFGLAGFLESIVFRQILHSHAFLSTKTPIKSIANLQSSLTVDGVLQVFLLIALIAGIATLFSAAKQKDTAFSGQLLFGGWFLGWGLFTLIE